MLDETKWEFEYLMTATRRVLFLAALRPALRDPAAAFRRPAGGASTGNPRRLRPQAFAAEADEDLQAFGSLILRRELGFDLRRICELLYQMASKPGPTPGKVVVACSYYTQENLQELLLESRGTEARELSTRLQGVAWLDNIRQALELPIQTFCTAAEKFQRFNLKYHSEASNWTDVAATALSLACKIEDTHKKPKDVLCAAYNLKVSAAEKVTPDHDMFVKNVTVLTGLERLMLEISAFDFRTRYPHIFITKITKLYQLHVDHRTTIVKTSFYMATDSYRTWAPLKHVPAAIALACVELAGRLHDHNVTEIEECKDYAGNGHFPEVTRPMVMECMLDLLDLYTHHRSSTIDGSAFPLDKYISVRITLNQEANTNDWPRFLGCSESFNRTWSTSAVPSPNEPGSANVNGGSNKTSPTSPAAANAPTSRIKAEVVTPSTPTSKPARENTMRFTLDRERAADEKATVDRYMEESEEEYEVEVEEEVEVPRRSDHERERPEPREPHGRDHRYNRRGRY